MWTSGSIFAGVIIGAIAVAIGISYLRLFVSMRGDRVVTCPETLQPVGLQIDARLAARTALVDNQQLRVTTCTRWPEKQDCAQECLSQVELRPEDTLLRNILREWYLDKDCSLCGRRIGDIEWHDAIPALRTDDGIFREWETIKAEEVTGLLETSLPVCWNCDLAEQFRQKHRDLVVDRSETPLRNRLIH
jgi:hypothetical protein